MEVNYESLINLTKVLADATQLNPQEQLQLVSHLINIWQQPPHLNKISNQISTDKTTTIPTYKP
jgi:hypothetical protein